MEETGTEPVSAEDEDALVAKIVAEAVKQLAPAMAPDRTKIAPAVYVSGAEPARETLTGEIDKALGIDKAYGRELHTCADETCANRDHGVRAARIVREIALHRRWGHAFSSQLIEDLVLGKATGGMLEGTNPPGGFLVPPEWHQDLIPLLRARAVVRAIGTPVYPMGSDITYIPRQSAAGTGYWAAEAASITASNQTLEQLTLTARRANALTFFSNEFLQDSNPRADEFIRNDLAKVLALLEDKAFLVGGAAVAGSPTGIYRNTAGTTYSVQAGVGTVAGSGQVTYDNLNAALGALEQANVAMVNPAWVAHGRDLQVIRGTKDGLGRPLFDGSSAGAGQVGTMRGNLMGYPLYVSNQMPTNVGGAAQSAIIFGDWNEAVIGERLGFVVDASSEATVVDPDGATLVNLFATYQTAIRIVERVDFQLRHAAGFAVITGLTA